MHSNSENRSQDEGMASSPPGFTPHLMNQQQSVPPIPSNEVAGMQNNGVPHSAPQMMPSYMYYNPYPWMGGLPQQPFIPPQFPQLGVQMPTSSMIPPVADQNAMTLPMNGQVPMFSPMDYQMMMMGAHMGGGMPMMPMMMGGQIPFMPYNMFMPAMIHANPSTHAQMGAMALPGNAPIPASIPMANQHTNCHPSSTQVSQEDDKSAIECNKPAKTEAFSTVQLLNTPRTPVPLPAQRAVKKEPVDQEAIPNTSIDSPIPDEFPGTPTSSDHRSTDHDAHDMPSQTLLMGQGDASAVPSLGTSSLEHLVEYDQYLSNETVDNLEEELSAAASSPHSDKHSFVENSPRISTTPDRLMIVESDESEISSSGVSEMNSSIEGLDEKTGEMDGRKKTSESNEPLTGHRAHSSIRPPSVPPRFPKPMKECGRWEERKSNPKGESSRGGTWTPMISIGDVIEEPRMEKMRNDAYSVLVKGVPPRLDVARIERVFQDKYGECLLTRVNGEPWTVKIQFDSKKHRDMALRDKTVDVSRHTLTVHGEVNLENEKRSESKEEERPRRGVRIRNTDGSTKQSDGTIKLDKFEIRCQGSMMKYFILTAGPIPEECSVSRVVDYFRGLQCNVLEVPFPSPRHRPYEYLILRFDELRQARKILAAQEHRVQGQVIPVSPPFDVHVKLYEMTDVENELMAILQEQCGIIVSHPSLSYRNKRHRGPYHYAYVTFGRPQDGKYAIDRNSFTLNREKISVIPVHSNYSFDQFEDVWEAKKRLDEWGRKITKEKSADKRKAIVLGEGKRRRRDTEESMDDDVIVCSPVKKKKEVKYTIQGVAHFKM